MKRMSLSIVVILLTTFAIGFITYRGLNNVLNEVSEANRPDRNLLLIKDISIQLQEIDGSVNSFSATKRDSFLIQYETRIKKLVRQGRNLSDLKLSDENVVDSIIFLLEKRIVLWDESIQLASTKNTGEIIDKVRASIEDIKISANSSQENSDEERGNLFQRMKFRREDRKNKSDDPTNADSKDYITEIKGDLKNKVSKIEASFESKSDSIQRMEVFYIAQGEEVMMQLMNMIRTLEEQEKKTLQEEIHTAESRLGQINIWVIVFCVAIFMLLLFLLISLRSFLQSNRRYRLAMKEAQEKTIELAKTKERFIANISHEIRTPLNAILGFSEQTMKIENVDEKENYVKIIHDSANHMMQLLNDVLNFYKLEAGQVKLEKIDFNLQSILKEVVEMLHQQAHRKGINLKLVAKKNPNLILSGDALRLKQIVLNLVGNAVKFTETGEVQVHGNVEKKPDGQLLVTIKVEDTGIGIAEEMLESIFIDFEQADPSITRQFGGTGLGLTISKQLVELQNGKISVESKVGKGTVFTIEIPYTSGRKVKKISRDQTVISEDVISGKRILVADDEEFNRKLIESILSKTNCEFDIVENGQKAHLLTKEKKYDLVLLDLFMPEMDGFQTAAKILTESDFKIPVLALTATTSAEDREKCLNTGFSSIVTKPFTEETLYRSIESALTFKRRNVEKRSEELRLNMEGMDEEVRFEQLKDLSNGDLNFYLEMLDSFVKSTQEGLAQMERAVEMSDYNMLRETSHRISSPTKYLGLEKAYRALKEIETNSKNEEKIDEIRTVLEKLKESFSVHIEAVEKEKSNFN